CAPTPPSPRPHPGRLAHCRLRGVSPHAPPPFLPLFFFHAAPPTETYPLSLHDALPIFRAPRLGKKAEWLEECRASPAFARDARRSEEHTSELQSPDHLVCRLLHEKKQRRPESSRANRSPAWSRGRAATLRRSSDTST